MAISRIQSTTATTTAGSTIAVTYGSSPTNGNFLVATISTKRTTSPVTSITQTGATWVLAISIVGTTIGANNTTDIWYAENISGASTSVTVNLGGSTNASCVFAEYSGLATSSTLDQTASDADDYGTRTNTTGTTSTTTKANELWIGGITDNTGSAWIGAGGGFTKVAESLGTLVCTAFDELIVSSTGTAVTSNSHTFVPLSGQWTGAIATFKDSSSTILGRMFLVFN